MKIFQINSVCGIKSTGRICTDLASIIEKAGVECHIGYGRENVPEKYKSISTQIGNKISVYSDVILSRVFDNAGFNSHKATKRLIEKIKSFEPDIIHLHNLHGYYVNIELLFNFLKEYKKPVVWTLHDCWAFTGHCAYFSGCDKWRTHCEKCPQKKEYPRSLLCDKSYLNYDKKKSLFASVDEMVIVTPSVWLKELAESSFLNKYPIKVINNGIDKNIFKPTESDFSKRYGIEDKKIVLGVASVWDQRKGFDSFLKLAEMLDERYVIVLVGVSEKQKKTLPANIIGISRTNSAKELAEIYTASDVFVNPTLQDNYPTTNLEAQACGTPVITFRTGGSVESVTSQGIVEQGDLEGLKEKIIDMGLDICSVPEKDMQYQKYVELYKDLMQ